MTNLKRKHLFFSSVFVLIGSVLAASTWLPAAGFDGSVSKTAAGACILDRGVDSAEGPGELSAEEAAAAYACIKGALHDIYASSGDTTAAAYQDWDKHNTAPYVSATHGRRFVNNYANQTGVVYGKFEEAGTMPVGAILAKDSFAVGKDGTVKPGPLFLMEKMPAGFAPDLGDWKYTLVTPSGRLQGVTNGPGSDKVQFCAGCHMAAEEYDYLFFMPPEVRPED